MALDSSVTALARSCAGLEVPLPGGPAILGNLIWLLGLRCPGQQRGPRSDHCQGLCLDMTYREGGRGHRFLFPILCIQPGMGGWAGLETEGLVLLGGVSLGELVSELQW